MSPVSRVHAEAGGAVNSLMVTLHLDPTRPDTSDTGTRSSLLDC